ncbi:MAG: zf-HC2 domain-containing protein [Thermoleophilia bacterium]|nr:zf-HC2 domain-containing protein [Thermoleophilia bacterium]
MTWVRSSACEQARFAAALAPDTVLSEIEARRLARHLGHCPACSAFAASVASFTAELRAAPLVAPNADLAQRSRTREQHRRIGEQRRATVVALSFPGGRPRMPRTSLIAAMGAAAVMLMTSVAVNRQAADAVFANGSGTRLVYAGVEDDTAMIRGLRDVAYARQTEPDGTLSKQPGIFAG